MQIVWQSVKNFYCWIALLDSFFFKNFMLIDELTKELEIVFITMLVETLTHINTNQ